jgi:hypothetical protein
MKTKNHKNTHTTLSIQNKTIGNAVEKRTGAVALTFWHRSFKFKF